MSLVDRTNESIALSMHGGEDIIVDHDADSSIAPGGWVTVFSNVEDQDFHFDMTYEEAELFRDRLNLILGVDTEASVE